LWDAAEAVLRRKFIGLNAYVKKSERTQISNLIMHFRLLEKQEQVKPLISGQKEIKIRVEINGDSKNDTKTQQNKTLFFFNRLTDRWTNYPKEGQKRPKTQINKIRDEKGNITTVIKFRGLLGNC
jgi:hypothetical protein